MSYFVTFFCYLFVYFLFAVLQPWAVAGSVNRAISETIYSIFYLLRTEK